MHTACNKDDDQGNIPPSEVTNVGAEVIEGTLVNIYWETSADENEDEISYDVVINNKLVASKTTDSSITFDVSEFIPQVTVDPVSISKMETVSKASNLELIIKIQAYDQNGGVSDEIEVIRSVFVNRVPEQFEIVNTYFDYDDYIGIRIEWTPAFDPDGDILSYDIYLNDIIIKENYVLSSEATLGVFYYLEESFEQYIDDDIVITVVANDRFGGTLEVSESYNFSATDRDLGVLTIPYNNSLNFEIAEDEPDSRVVYTFEITEAAGSYSMYTYEFTYFYLYDANGNRIDYGYSGVSGSYLNPGIYKLEIEGYYNDEVSGTITMQID